MIPCRNMIVSLILFDSIDLIHHISSISCAISFSRPLPTFLRTLKLHHFASGLLHVQSHISLLACEVSCYSFLCLPIVISRTWLGNNAYEIDTLCHSAVFCLLLFLNLAKYYVFFRDLNEHCLSL
jgi:hypothetical protein